MKAPIRVLLVDDSSFVRNASERMLKGTDDIEVVGTAANGREAVERTLELRPDAIVMDVNMPEMSGMEALERIMRERPTPVLLMSTATREGAETTIRGLELGAVDFLDKGSVGPVINLYDLAPVLRDKIRAVARAELARAPAPGDPATGRPDPAGDLACAGCDIIAIGASTGGPRALSKLFDHLPGDLDAAVIIAQHMPEGFTESLAERLDRRSPLRIREASDGDAVETGTVLVTPGRRDVEVARNPDGRLVTRISPTMDDRTYHPSVNLLFQSLARVAPQRTVGVVLTGMGQDGANGLRALRDAGGRTIAESESTALIFGMPRAAAASADQVLALPDIATMLFRMTRRTSEQGGAS